MMAGAGSGQALAPLPRPVAGETVTLLGIRFDRLTRDQALTTLESAFGCGEAWKVYIVNTHTMNLAWTDPEFRQVLNRADLLLNDGSGAQIASRLAGKPFPDNLVGTDLVPQLCEGSARRGKSVYLLGGRPGTPERAAASLARISPGLRVAGTQQGYFPESENPRVVKRINQSGAGILLVAFGNPSQEQWIHAHAPLLRCDLCIGVGGLCDHLSGRLKRAPRWMRRLGIEWVFILLCQPYKWRRYLVGNPLFLARLVVHHFGWKR